jgi:hypothetical protein
MCSTQESIPRKVNLRFSGNLEVKNNFAEDKFNPKTKRRLTQRAAVGQFLAGQK